LKNFSLFEQALKIAGPQVNLGTLSSISRRDFNERDSFIFRAQAPSLEYASLMIENSLLLKTNRSTRIYAGFEKLSFLQPVVERYLRIADISECVYVFGEGDWQPPRHPNLRCVPLSPDLRLVREWFLIADSPAVPVALVALDEEGFEGQSFDKRVFSAFKSSEPRVVRELAGAVEGLINWSLAA